MKLGTYIIWSQDLKIYNNQDTVELEKINNGKELSPEIGPYIWSTDFLQKWKMQLI